MIDACASSVALGGGSLRGDATTLKIVQVSPVFGLLCVKVAIFDCVDTAKAVYFVSLIESRVSSREWSTNSLKTEHPSSCQSNAAQFKCPAVSLPSSQVTCSLALGQKRRRSGSLGSMGGICRVRCGRDQARVRRFVRWLMPTEISFRNEIDRWMPGSEGDHMLFVSNSKISCPLLSSAQTRTSDSETMWTVSD